MRDMTTSEPRVVTRYHDQVTAHLTRLTVDILDRSVGSAGNSAATAYVHEVLKAGGWSTETQSFDAIDWCDDGATLLASDGTAFEVFASPYAPGCQMHARLTAASTLEELVATDTFGALLLLHGTIAETPLLPKNFPFYSVEEHQRTIGLLENCGAAAIICAGPRGGAGGVYPAAMIEDGDFNVPSVFMTEEKGGRLLRYVGQSLSLISRSRRIPSRAANVIGRINRGAPRRVVITAHIDAKKNAPGALDNGTGIAALLLLSRLLADYRGEYSIELVALNGEDHYAVPGQVAYLSANRDLFDTVALNINIDGIGYIDGDTAFSFFDVTPEMKKVAAAEILTQQDSREGPQWPQGDHGMFVQSGCPAIAVTSSWLLENMTTQTVTHSSSDSIELVSIPKVASCAFSLARFVEELS